MKQLQQSQQKSPLRQLSLKLTQPKVPPKTLKMQTRKLLPLQRKHLRVNQQLSQSCLSRNKLSYRTERKLSLKSHLMLQRRKTNLKNSCQVSSRTRRSLIKMASAKYSESKESANSRTLRRTSKKHTENLSLNEGMNDVSITDKTNRNYKEISLHLECASPNLCCACFKTLITNPIHTHAYIKWHNLFHAKC